MSDPTTSVEALALSALCLLVDSDERDVSRRGRSYLTEVVEKVLSELFSDGDDDDPGVRTFATPSRTYMRLYFSLKEGSWVAWGQCRNETYEEGYAFDSPLVAVERALTNLSRVSAEEASELRAIVESRRV